MTFAYKVDAYEAVEHGNDDPHLPKYDLSFGGRRAFCKETYADLGKSIGPHFSFWGGLGKRLSVKTKTEKKQKTNDCQFQMRLTMMVVPRPMTWILRHC